MKKKLLSLCMALAMMLALLPTPVIGKEPEAHLTETIDYSHYLTDSVITKKELMIFRWMKQFKK